MGPSIHALCLKFDRKKKSRMLTWGKNAFFIETSNIFTAILCQYDDVAGILMI
jgi:hypothetical protein